MLRQGLVPVNAHTVKQAIDLRKIGNDEVSARPDETRPL